MKYDVAVIGLGGMGSAILAQSAHHGASAIGIEQYQRAHDLGSSHGRSRMFRKSYFEAPDYVPLLHRASELWRELEQETGTKLLEPTGVLTVGEETSKIVAGTKRAAQAHDLPLLSLGRREMQTRYPSLKLLPDEIALFEEDAGVLNPEEAVCAHLDWAGAQGAEMRFGINMTRWHKTDFGFEIALSDGTVTTARTLILALGPWFKETLEALGVPIRIQRNVQVWFEPLGDAYTGQNFPSFLLDRRGLPAPLYGFPDFGYGVKAAFHGLGQDTTAGEIDRAIDQKRDLEPLRLSMEDWMPGAAHRFRHASACMYTFTPDEHFVIDRHPSHPNLILCGGFSGHGFKFAPVIGEIVAELAVHGGTRHEVDFLGLGRFLNSHG
ncbi:MAG: N-methyl-L-tryptophan oxidase [Chthoniobacterales bacterium]